MQVARDALPPYISKDTADSILFIGKAVRVLKQSASGKRPSGVPLTSRLPESNNSAHQPRMGCTLSPSVSCIVLYGNILHDHSVLRSDMPQHCALSEGEMTALLSMIMESWIKDLRQIQSAAVFHRLEFERVISSMQTQVHVRYLISLHRLCITPAQGLCWHAG